MATYNLALILGNPSNDAEFLLAKQTPPPKLGIEEYDSFVDSDLWDLPSKKLELVEGELEPGSFVIEGIERTTLRKFDFDSAINKVLEQVGFTANDGGEWRFLKHLEEAEFGPGLPVHTVYISGKLLNRNQNLPELCKWMSIQSCLSWLVDVKPSSDRVGPLVVLGLINDSEHSSGKVDTALDYQEYPPGVIIVPMRSRTAKPFHTTNLVVFAPESVKNKCEDYNFVAHGDALIVDPGCRANFHKELLTVLAPLSKKLVVFVTHHHRDHVDGLSVIQKCNPNATLLAHKNSMRRIGKGDWSLNHISVSGGEDICIGGQRLNIIFAPGHTDGHLALLHVDTHSLIVGDHCVGQGSALLDITSGGNMTDYFQSTYKFIDLAPHVLIPMHGRVNLWPKRMLCGYLKNRRSIELSILEAIENGAKTLIDIVANVYSEVDRSLWIPASSNVRLHVEHLAQQNKLPKSCLSWLVDVKPSSDRVGPLVVLGLINDSEHSSGKVDTALDYQEYPPGVIIVPMRSRTAKPFHTTNLVVFAPESVKNKCEDYNFVAHGDALIVDPGCRANFHKELLTVLAPLSKKLVVFVTHHHRDHVDGLSVIQKCNPNATLLAHKNSMRRIGKGDWSLNHISVSGGEDICIGGQRLNIIFAPGHTDGHLALLHVDTHSLIVGDHCVGQGSALLDITSGGNMTDYFQSTYKFIDLAPHVLIPMHGRVNLWPKRMLCGYLKNRRSRELSILEAIENGAKTLIDIVANVYSEVDRSLWIPASSNVRLHVEHLAQQNKLPKEFSIKKFQRTCGVHFISRWIWAYLAAEFLSRSKNPHILKILIGGAVVSFAVLYSLKYKLS